MHIGETFQPGQFADGDAAEPADPAQVIAQQVHDHQVFGLVFFAANQFPGQRLVLGAGPAPGTGPLDRPGDNMALGVEAEKTFRRGGRDGGAVRDGEKGGKGRRRQRPQAPVEHERVQPRRQMP